MEDAFNAIRGFVLGLFVSLDAERARLNVDESNFFVRVVVPPTGV